MHTLSQKPKLAGNEAVEFTPKELQCFEQGKITEELKRDSRFEGQICLGNKIMWILQLGKQ